MSADVSLIRILVRRALGGGVAAVAVLLLVTGCTSYDKKVSALRASYLAGDMTAAAEISVREACDAGCKDELIWWLEAGAACRSAGRIEESQRWLQKAEQAYDGWQEKAKVSLSGEAVALFTNPAELPYRGMALDAVMINVYQTLNALRQGNAGEARQAIIRGFYHQQDAVELNAKRIEKEQAAVAKDKNAEAIRKSQADANTMDARSMLLTELPDTTGYENYVNPFAVYLDAFYHLYLGVDADDRERARFTFRRALSLTPENEAIRHDLAAIEAGKPLEPAVYLFFETGMAPRRVGKELILPIYAGKTFSFVSMAFPSLEMTPGAAEMTFLSAPGGAIAAAQRVCDMDAVVAQEFKNDLPVIWTRVVATATAKAVAAYAANYAARQSDNGWVQIGTLLFTGIWQVATNVADTRSWNTLPKRFAVARLPMPAEREVSLRIDGASDLRVPLGPTGDVWVIYARSASRGAPTTVHTFKIR